MRIYRKKRARNSEMMFEIRSGLTFKEVSSQYNLTPQAVQLIAKKMNFKRCPSGYLPVSVLAEMLHCCPATLYYGIKRGRIVAQRLGSQWFIPSRNYLLKKCVVCGSEVGMCRSIYCSDGCAIKAMELSCQT